MDVLKDHEAVKQLGSILKTNVRACKALGMYNVIYLSIYKDNPVFSLSSTHTPPPPI